jgi:hypothetical protein
MGCYEQAHAPVGFLKCKLLTSRAPLGFSRRTLPLAVVLMVACYELKKNNFIVKKKYMH